MRANRGFTLIEVLIVVSIIAMLFTISWPALNKARLKVREAKLRADLDAVRRAYQACKNDTGGIGPSSLNDLTSATPPAWGYLDLGTGRGWPGVAIKPGDWNGPYIKKIPRDEINNTGLAWNSGIARATNTSPIWLPSGAISSDGTAYNTW
jgi:prepilin-type N-terminal cleavage/methylation domain-containing protein